LRRSRPGPVEVTRLAHRIEPDPGRVIPRFFSADEAKTRRRIDRVLSLDDGQATRVLNDLQRDYGGQHEDIERVWLDHYEQVKGFVPVGARNTIGDGRKLLLGAYFTMEYSIESAALFNPSIVPTANQDGLPEGSTRFLMSLRATGEGHISSIVFRAGVIDSNYHIIIEDTSPISMPLKTVPDAQFETARFGQTLREIGAVTPGGERVLENLGEEFTLPELEAELERVRPSAISPAAFEECAENMLTLARSNYKYVIPDEAFASEIVIFPASENESRGIEDLRLVRFTEDDGTSVLYGTYTAYNGFAIFPTLLENREPGTVEIHPMAGRYAKNKGMALFPRKVGGKYVMSGRLDGENLYLLESDNVRVWNDGRLAQKPRFWWEFSIIGKCGSPMETDEGWLLLTHGVGPMRQYCIGAALLDLDEPWRVIGRTREPLIVPIEDERTGYVPNVVYTCGSMIHNDRLVIPYAASDMHTTFASVSLLELLEALKEGGK
jgi:predicted GH43/DUF377 family glycosyl hydrolase